MVPRMSLCQQCAIKMLRAGGDTFDETGRLLARDRRHWPLATEHLISICRPRLHTGVRCPSHQWPAWGRYWQVTGFLIFPLTLFESLLTIDVFSKTRCLEQLV